MRHLPAVLVVAFLLALIAPSTPTFAEGLKDDGRAGVVTAVQGVAVVRPVGRERWTPLDARGLVFPGDLVRTEARGANALELRLAKGGRLILGPGTLLELPDAGGVRLVRGEMEAKGDAKAPIAVTGPGGFNQQVSDVAWLRATDRETKPLAKEPRWLQGYRASTSEEWMGSLLANVSGRNVPLTVGYHKVTVEIRDQIARTTVEESFVNSTDALLEGVFSFPLPADASISGFGMWIGDELVEADIVEKQRAREIYEDILRRKKDPGLLEWEGGNLFKARVYPIFPHSEKRIRIRYTEVLPLEGDAYRYRYALRSELLRLNPLRELKIEVSVLSTTPIGDVSSPTHEVTLRKSEHEAVVEFGAQEYVPERDFEVAVSLGREGRGEGLTAVAHRRGDDGFFMLLLAPPDPSAAGWQRDLVPEGAPLDLVLLADTSGSMDPASREAQAQVIAGILAQLAEKDRFRLAAFDVTPRWFAEDALPATEENVVRALAFLDGRFSLGWTDLGGAFDAVLAKAAAGTHVVYVGDGIHTAHDPDPVAVADRIRSRAKDAKATFHAVSTSAAYEKSVLEAIASVGGGSVRRGEDAPAKAAQAILGEIARPGVRDLKVSVEGVPTARVYPAVLPNIPLGQQQVVLGRFLPGPAAASANVVVTGTLAGKAVRFSSSFQVPAPEEGNSFLPRLWARRHLDVLLAQGASAETKEEIVAFSREYQIMTPHTSFLVLESDEDRERYGVERTVKMRDAERFFAEAKDKAALEIARGQMLTAQRWRLDLRRRMLREIAGLGRELPIPVAAVGWVLDQGLATGGSAQWGGRGGGGRERLLRASYEGGDGLVSYEDGSASGLEVDFATEMAPEGMPGDRGDDLGMPMAAAAPSGMPAPSPVMSPPAEPPGLEGAGDDEADDVLQLEEELADAGGKSKDARGSFASRRRGLVQDRLEVDAEGYAMGYLSPGATRPGLSTAELGFPGLEAPPAEPPPFEEPAWDAVATEAIRSLERDATKLTGPMRVTREGVGLHALRERALWRHRGTHLLSPRRWFLHQENTAAEPWESWVGDEERGVLHVGRRLGRKRPAVDADRKVWPLDPVLTLRSLSAQYRRPPEVAREGDVVRLTFRPDRDPWARLVLAIDVAKGLLLEQRTEQEGRATSVTRWSDPVEAGGLWWARASETLDDDGRVVTRYTTTVEALDATTFGAAFDAAVAGHGDAIFLGLREPDLVDAKQAVHDGRAELPHRIVVALHHGARQRWDAMWEVWRPAEAALAGKPGLPWIRHELLVRSRRAEETRDHVMALAKGLVARRDVAAPALASWLDLRSVQVLGPREALALVRAVAPLWTRPGPDAEYWHAHGERRLAQLLAQAGFRAEARAKRQALAKDRAWDVHDVLAFANGLASIGDQAGAAAYLRGRLREGGPWSRHEAASMHQSVIGWLWNLRDVPGMRAATDDHLATKPQDAWGYQVHVALLYLESKPELADRWVLDRLATAVDAMRDRVTSASVEAAIQMGLGHAWGFQLRTIVPEWRGPLADLALRLMRSDSPRSGLSQAILNDWRFHQTEERRVLLQTLRADLTSDAVASMSLERLDRYVRALAWGRNDVDETVWRTMVDALLTRWRTTKDLVDADVLADAADLLLEAHGATDERILFLRERMRRAVPRDVPARAQALFDLLVAGSLDVAKEAEAFSLLPQLLPPETKALGETGAVGRATRVLAQKVFDTRRDAALGEPAERSKWTRAEATQKTREAVASARTETAARFAAALDGAAPLVRPWLEVERLGYFVETKSDLARAEADSREMLDPLRRAAAAEGNDDAVLHVLGERSSLVLAYAATRRETPEGLADRVLALYRERLGASDRLLDWRYQIFRLLVALDRVEELETTLASWVRPDEVESRWRIALAYLYAETSRPKEAASTMEGAEALDDLPATAWAVLADWYLALKDDAKRERALEKRYEAIHEWQLGQMVAAEAAKMQPRGDALPAALDPEALRMLRVLLRKAENPQYHVGHVSALYRPSKDFRALESLADGVAGHTAEAVYQYLQAAAHLVQEIHEEATCDALVARIDQALASAKRDVDRRALRLLLAAVESRAGQVPKADPGHAEKAVRALRAAAEGAYVAGERRLFAEHLTTMNAQEAGLAAEQLARLQALLDAADEGPMERLVVGSALSRVLWARGRRDDAVDRLGSLLDEVRQAEGGTHPPEADGAYQMLIGWWTEVGHFRRAEDRLRKDLASEIASERRDRLRMGLFDLYTNALSRGGALRAGAGPALYAAAVSETERHLFEGPAYLINETADKHGHVHRAAVDARVVPGAGVDYERFVRERLPEALTRSLLESLDLLQSTMGHLDHLRGPLPPLAFVLGRIQGQPAWHDRIGLDAWGRFAGWMASWRHRAGRVGALEQPLLAVVLAKLEAALVTMEHEGSGFWHRHQQTFWHEHRREFAAVASRVAELRAKEYQVVLHVAGYLRDGLALAREAVALLQGADADPKAPEAVRSTLARWLSEDKRFAEAVPVLERLVAARLDNLEYRTLLVRSLHGSGRGPDALKALEAAAAHWKDVRKTWNAHVAATLAHSAVDAGFAKHGAEWIDDALRMRREAGGRAGPDQQLSAWYQLLARARSQLGETDAAVRAASAAVVAWGRDLDHRAAALNVLRDVLGRAKDLDAWLARYEAEVAESGLDAPTIRTSLAQVFLQRGELRKAAHHFTVARDLDPGDAQTHAHLVETLAKAGDPKGALEALLASVRMAPKNLAAYPDLAGRFQSMGDAENAERARTNLVEAMPNEAEGWGQLAKLREAGRRWPLAVPLWRQVVRIRSLEPDGFLSLANAQIESGDREGARATIDHLLRTAWDARFGDVRARAAPLLQRVR